MADLFDDLMSVNDALQGCDACVLAAWKRLRERLTAFPPTAGGRGYDGAAQLADHLHKMGRVPRRDERGMELLLFRWVVAAEEMSSLLGRIVLGDEPAMAATAPMNGQAIVVDEAYQPGYCDECGGMLPPSGECFICKG